MEKKIRRWSRYAKCIICDKELALQGLYRHMEYKHEAKPIEDTNYYVVEYTAKERLPQTQRRSGKVQCTICNKVLGTPGVGKHMRFQHKETASCNVNYVKIKAANNLVTEKKEKPEPLPHTMVGPDTQYIDIPVILRVPLSMGPIQIVSLDGKEYEL